jgi:APA family basic amino acid/polyamine antiporter
MTQAAATRRLPVSLALYRTSSARHRLPAQLGTFNLVLLGMGVMIGGGIYSLAGKQAATMAGPAVILSFAVGAVVCGCAALCYAELSSILPVSGGVYTFSYVAFGEVWAWFVGWALILELVVAGGVVSRLFSGYAISTVDSMGVEVPALLAKYGDPAAPVNLVAPVVIGLLTLLIMGGSRLTGRALSLIVTIKVAAIVLIIVVGAKLVDTANYHPFIPKSRPAEAGATLLGSVFGFAGSTFGIFGIFGAAVSVAFAYIGFDLIATSAEDTKDARRTVPRAIVISFILVAVLYLAIATVLIGLRPYTELGTDAPVVDAMVSAGAGTWVAVVVGFGAMLGMATVTLVVLISLGRVLFAMGRDGLLPSGLAGVSSYNAPAKAAAAAGLGALAVALYPKALELGDLLVLGAMFAFFFSAIGVLVLRRTQPEVKRGFTIPLGPVVPVVAALSVLWLGLNIDTGIWLKFLIWMAIGVCAYLAYGFSHSRLAVGEDDEEALVPAAAAPQPPVATAPAAPTPAAPTPAAPTQVAPTPAAPTQVAPTQVAAKPVAPMSIQVYSEPTIDEWLYDASAPKPPHGAAEPPRPAAAERFDGDEKSDSLSDSRTFTFEWQTRRRYADD